MPQLTIARQGDEGVFVLPVAILESVGLHIGDVVDVSVGDRHLILRRADDAARAQRIEELTRAVFEERGDAYQRLA